MLERTRRLSAALAGLGVQPGDRVATLAWASQEHLEAYLAVPSIGAVLHTLNLRLHPDDLAYIVNDARDRILIVDESLLPLFETFRAQTTTLEHVIVVAGTSAGKDADPVRSATPAASLPAFLDYESVLTSADPAAQGRTCHRGA